MKDENIAMPKNLLYINKNTKEKNNNHSKDDASN